MLLIPITGFLSFDDERVQGTIDATLDRLVDENGLVHRYEGRDGLPGEEGAFLLCSFWLVDVLALSARTDEFAVEYVNLKECRTIFSAANEILFALGGEKQGAYAGLDGVFEVIWEIRRSINEQTSPQEQDR